MKNFLLFLPLFVFSTSFAQLKSKVSITIDDVPNVNLYGNYLDNNQPLKNVLLQKITKQKIPVAIFINEIGLYQHKNLSKTTKILQEWIENPLVTVGNHTYSHINFSDTTLTAFEENVLKGEIITKNLLKNTSKKLRYFRFPYNAAGKDSLMQSQILAFLTQHHYISTPFTIQSEDYLYNELYIRALAKKDSSAAKAIAQEYIEHTATLFDFFGKFCQENYGRNINHIFLCHDNQLNADNWEKIMATIQACNYEFISLDVAIKDPIYQSKNYYYEKGGISWIYRWIPNKKERLIWMRKEPDVSTETTKKYQEKE